MSIAGDYRCAAGNRLRGAHGAFRVERMALSPAVVPCALQSRESAEQPRHAPASATPAASPTLRLRPGNLTDMEIARIDAFLRVGRHRLACEWHVVLNGPCDVVMLGSPLQDSEFAEDWDASTILRVQEGHVGQGANALVRPLQYDAFVDALAVLERTLPTQPLPALTSPARVASPAPAVPAPAPRAFLGGPPARFRLRRWPPAAILETHRYNIRLASFMSGRHVGLCELIRLSNVDRTQCEQFLIALDDAAILEVELAGASPAPRAFAPGNAEAPPRRLAVERGFLERLRSRLGLTGPR